LSVSSIVLCLAASGSAEEARGPRVEGRVFVPETSIALEEDAGFASHTNHRILMEPAGGLGPSGGMTPTQIASFYGVNPGGSGVIAIVDAYNYPAALNDFNVFATQFGLPVETSSNAAASTNQVFQVVYASGAAPANNASWNEEEALDIEWAHAMAPNAKIILVEANSANDFDLFAAVEVAAAIAEVKQVSMSWAGGESFFESYFDGYLNAAKGPIYFASTGDSGGMVEYPSCSPFVVAAGGTSVATSGTGEWMGETGWPDGGGGNSRYEARPSWQSAVSGVGSRRGVPDISSDSDPNTGVAVYDSISYEGYVGWLVFGGTSVASPSLAAMMNSSGASFANTTSFLTALYANFKKSGYADFRDIISGGHNNDAKVGWDYATGIGVPIGPQSF